MGITIALAVMVKDEAKTIEACFTSALPLIDRIVVLDTGSTDNTIEVMRAFAERNDIPIDIEEHAFEGFGPSRTRLLAFARGKADWILMLDADWSIALQPDKEQVGMNWGTVRTVLEEAKANTPVECFSVVHAGDVAYWQPHFIRGDREWKYIGMAHEYLERSDICTKMHGVEIRNRECAPVERVGRTKRNLKLLLETLAEDPKNGRTLFYIGRTYFDMGMRDLARVYLKERIKIGGFPEELFEARLMAAYCQAPSDPAEFWEVWASRPSRAEPLFWLARAYQQRGELMKALDVNALRAKIPFPKDDVLFVDKAAYGPDAKCIIPE